MTVRFLPLIAALLFLSYTFALKPAAAQTFGNASVMLQTFNDGASGEGWGKLSEYVAEGCGPDGSACLRLPYEPCDRGSARIGAKIPLPPSEAYTLEFWVMFEEGWEAVKGGKMHGLAPAKLLSGCAPGGPDLWSSRMMWREGNAIVNYIYAQNRQQNCGADIADGDYAMAIGEWQRITLYVKVNTPGVADGVSIVYVNGTVVASSNTQTFRGNVSPDQALIEQVSISTFFGGSGPEWAPTKTVYARFDNFGVASGQADPSVPITAVNGAANTPPPKAPVGPLPNGEPGAGKACKDPPSTAGTPVDSAIISPGDACICPVAEAGG